MSDPLDEIHGLLDGLETDLAQIKAFWKEVEELNPGFDPVSEENCKEKHARMWLHGGTQVHECK